MGVFVCVIGKSEDEEKEAEAESHRREFPKCCILEKFSPSGAYMLVCVRVCVYIYAEQKGPPAKDERRHLDVPSTAAEATAAEAAERSRSRVN